MIMQVEGVLQHYTEVDFYDISFDELAPLFISSSNWTLHVPTTVTRRGKPGPHPQIWTLSVSQTWVKEMESERWMRDMTNRTDNSTRKALHRADELTWRLFTDCQPYFRSSRTQLLRMAFDLQSVGENLARYGFVEAIPECPMCGKEDLATHWMYCGSEEVRGVHDDMFTAIDAVARKARDEDALQHTFIDAVITEIKRTVDSNAAQAPGFVPSRAKPLLGLWPPEQIQDIMRSLPLPQRTSALGQAVISKLRSSLVTIHKITTQHVFKIWSIRKRRHPHASTAPHQHRQRRLRGTRTLSGIHHRLHSTQTHRTLFHPWARPCLASPRSIQTLTSRMTTISPRFTICCTCTPLKG